MRTGGFIRFIACLTLLLICASCAAPSAPQSTARGAAAVEALPEGRYVREVFPELDVVRDIEYGSAVNESGETQALLLDVYQPKGDGAERRPAVIFVHGGGFTSGDKASGVEQMLAELLAKKGYVTLSINYRLRKKPGSDWVGTFRDSTQDAYAAYEWLVQHKDEYRIDTDHIAFGGHSAGSNIVVDLCYSDWSGRGLAKDGVFAVIAMAGPETVAGNPDQDDPFCLIIHGVRDELVPFSLSERFADQLKAAGTPYLFHPLPISAHNIDTAIREVGDTVTSALYKRLTGSESGIAIREYEQERRQMLAERLTHNRTVDAHTISVTIDGKLDEWPESGFMPLDRLKDAGDALPGAEDMTASGMVAWDAGTPGCLCAAVKVRDDVFQEDGNPNFWENDSVELLLDFSDDETIRPIVQWTVNVNGRDVHVSNGKTGACEVKTVRQGDSVVFEIRVDIARALPELAGFTPQGKTIGLSLGYNDCEGGTRQHQTGIVAGDTWTPKNFANFKTDGT